MQRVTGRLVAAAFLTVVVAVGAIGAQSDNPFEVYRAYLAVLAKAQSLDVLLPYYTQELRGGLSKMPKEMQANYLKMNRRTLSDVKVTKEQVDASSARFEMTAKTADGRQTQGSASLVKEAGAWKIDDEAWVANVPQR